MRKWSLVPNGDTDDITVYIGAHVPPRLYQLMVEEATQAGLSHSKMIGRILTERYREQADKVTGQRESKDGEVTEPPIMMGATRLPGMVITLKVGEE